MTERKIKKFHSDNCTEFVNHELETFFKAKGISHSKSPQYTPESNGVAESSIKILVNKCRSLLAIAKIPISFWGEALCTSVYLKKITPIRKQKYKTPHELLFNRKPMLSN